VLTLKLALRTLARRSGRMALIGSLVALGTFVVVFGATFASSAAEASRDAIVEHFTGDLIVYSSKAKDLPSPFAFNTPLPRIRDAEAVEAFLRALPGVRAIAPYAQNYGIVQAEREGRKVDLPFVFYAIEPASYAEVFGPIRPSSGSALGGSGGERGLMISEYQNGQYEENYGLRLAPGERVTLLGVTEGGVGAAASTVLGTFAPERYASVFNYINFLDAGSYAELYSFAGVEALPEAFERGLAAAEAGEDAIFGLAGDASLSSLDLGGLVAAPLSGATMIAVRLEGRGRLREVMGAIEGAGAGLEIKAAPWDAASGFYAQISRALQAFIFAATALIFLVVALIFTNTLIINVTERAAEIGTMRALGADRSFVGGLFVAEALALNLASAAVGMLAAGAAILAFAGRGLPLPETVSQFLIGGGPLPLRPAAWPFALGTAVAVLVSILATAYPVRVAASIAPVKAMGDK